MMASKTETSLGKHLPLELWVEVLSFLSHPDLARALCTSRALARIGFQAWRAACYRRWPAWASIADESEADWQRTYELLLLRESERDAIPDVAAVRKQQNMVTERHRTILVEWLCEVGF
jgi:F-box domain